MNLKGLTAIAFDLDGTLCDYGVSIREAIAGALRCTGRPIDQVGDLDAAAMQYNALWYQFEQDGPSAISLRERIWEQLLAEHHVNEPGLAHTLAGHYTRIRLSSVRLSDGARELLLDLGDIYRLGLLTNGRSDMQWPKIEHLKIRSLFDAILVSGDVGIHKPDPRIFQTLLRRLGVMAKETLYVGNSPAADVVGAKGVGMLAALIGNGDEEPLVEAIADIELDRIGALREGLL